KFRVEHTSSATKAKQLFVEFHPDVVLVDVVLSSDRSDRSGLHLSEELAEMRAARGYYSSPEIICFSSKALDSDTIGLLAERGIDYLRKTDADFVGETVKAAVDRIDEFKQGPTLVLEHRSPNRFDTVISAEDLLDCSPGEIVHGISIALPFS